MTEGILFYSLAALAILIAGIAKSGFGGGLGVLSVPLMALVISPVQAAAILLPILCLMDLINIWHYRKSWDRTNIKILLPAALLGVVIGTFTFRYLSDGYIRILIGLIAITFTFHYFRQKSEDSVQSPDPVRGGFWGLIAGFVSFGVHAGGPPANVYLLPQRLDKTIFVGTMVVLFTTLNFVKLVPYSFLGQLNGDNMMTSAILTPVAPLGVWIGLKLHNVIEEDWFYLLCYIFLFVTGAKLLWDGVAAEF